jgi:hypothetical protein
MRTPASARKVSRKVSLNAGSWRSCGDGVLAGSRAVLERGMDKEEGLPFASFGSLEWALAGAVQ